MTQLEQKKIKVILKSEETRKNIYNILLGGSTYAGKTTYCNSFITKRFCHCISTLSHESNLIKEINKTKFFLLDGPRWGGNYDLVIINDIKDADGIILMFDLSYKEDFDDLPHLLDLITKIHNLEDFPVLLIGNKSDLNIQVQEHEIKKFMKKGNFIGYFEVSCKTHKNVDESVNFIINYIFKKEKKKFL